MPHHSLIGIARDSTWSSCRHFLQQICPSWILTSVGQVLSMIWGYLKTHPLLGSYPTETSTAVIWRDRKGRWSRCISVQTQDTSCRRPSWPLSKGIINFRPKKNCSTYAEFDPHSGWDGLWVVQRNVISDDKLTMSRCWSTGTTASQGCCVLRWFTQLIDCSRWTQVFTR